MPMSAHESICQMVHGPWPRNTFETSAVVAPTANPAAGPRTQPVTITRTVDGWTPGIAANATRPAADRAPRLATAAISRDESDRVIHT